MWAWLLLRVVVRSLDRATAAVPGASAADHDRVPARPGPVRARSGPEYHPPGTPPAVPSWERRRGVGGRDGRLRRAAGAGGAVVATSAPSSPASSPPRWSSRAAAVVVAMRIANGGPEPEGQNWWLVAWFVVGLAYAVAGTALLTRPGRRLLGGCFVVVGVAATIMAVATQYERLRRPTTLTPAGRGSPEPTAGPSRCAPACSPRSCRGSCCHRRARHAHALAWCEHGGGRRRARRHRRRRRPRPLELAATWVVAARRRRRPPLLGVPVVAQPATPVTRCRAGSLAGAVGAWLAVVPRASTSPSGGSPGATSCGRCCSLATVPLLVAGAVVEALREIPSRYHRVSHRVVEWTVLAAGIVVVYTGIVAGLGRLVGGSGPTWFLVAATGVIAVALEPGRHRVRRLVDRLVYGARDDPLAVVQRVVDHLGADSGDDLLPALVASLQRRAAPRRRGHRPAGARRLAAGRRDRAGDDPPARRRAAPPRRRRRPPRRRLGGRPVAARARRGDPRPAHRPAQPGRRLGAPGRRPAPVERGHRVGARGGAAAPAPRPPRRARTGPDRCLARPAHGRPPARALGERRRRVARRGRCSSASPTRSTPSSSSSSASSATCGRRRSTSSASSAPSPSSPARSTTICRSTSPCRRRRSSCRPPSRWRRTASSPRR